MATTVIHTADSRGHANHGWLNAHHSFSFAGWYNPERIHFGVLRVLNDDIVMGGEGFGKHPHDNMEIITLVLKGALEHKDSMGHTQAIHPGEVQVMSAGTGVFHSEYNHHKEEEVNLLQIWIFPDKKNVQPRYDQRMFGATGRANQMQILVSPIDKNEEGLKIHQDAYIYRAQLDAGKSVEHKAHSRNHGFYIFIIDGGAEINGNSLSRRDAIGISEEENIRITAEKDTDVLILEVPMQV